MRASLTCRHIASLGHSTYHAGGVVSGTLVRTGVAPLAAGERPLEWPRPGERAWIPHLTVRTPDGMRPIMLEATYYPAAGAGPAPLAIISHGSDAGRNQLRTISHSTEAHWLHTNGFAVLALMRRGRGRSEGINGEEDFGRDHNGHLIDLSAGIAQAVEDLESAIACGRKLPSIRPGPVLLVGQSRGGFLAVHYAGLKPSEVMGVVNFSGGWYPYGPVTTPYYANAGRGAANKIPELWFYADNDRLQVDGAQVVAVELHEVERPEHEVGLGPFVHLPMELLEAVGVNEFGVDGRRPSMSDSPMQLVGSCLETRVRYGGWREYVWQRPQMEAA